MDLDLLQFRLCRWFAGIAKDKKLHFGAGVLVAVLVTLVGASALQAILASAVAGLVKEYYDYRHPAGRTVDHRDVVATTLGGVLATLAIDAARWLT